MGRTSLFQGDKAGSSPAGATMRSLSNGNQVSGPPKTNDKTWTPKGITLPIMKPSTLFLDIDDVLMLWGSLEHKYVAHETKGFDDWQKTKARHFNYWSPSQLELIKQTFPNIYWMTTWVKGDACNNHFSPITGFGERPQAITLIKNHVPLSSHEHLPIDPDPLLGVSANVFTEGTAMSLRYARWWKLNLMAAIIKTGGLPEGKIVWADNDIAFSKDAVEEVLEDFGVRDRFYLAAPSYAWSREDIMKAGEWINE